MREQTAGVQGAVLKYVPEDGKRIRQLRDGGGALWRLGRWEDGGLGKPRAGPPED